MDACDDDDGFAGDVCNDLHRSIVLLFRCPMGRAFTAAILAHARFCQHSLRLVGCNAA